MAGTVGGVRARQKRRMTSKGRRTKEFLAKVL